MKPRLAFAGVLVIVMRLPMAQAEPVRCANGQENIYQNAPCPADYVEIPLRKSIPVIETQRPTFDQAEERRGMVGRHQPQAHTPRDPVNMREFRALFPCPATLEETGPCPGWVVDHKIPLACGGPDDFRNMQWQTVEEAKAKDKVELLCGR